MATLDEMIVMRDALERARFTGTLTVRSGEESVTYKSDAEMAAALAALNQKIASSSGVKTSRIIYPSYLKG